MIRVACPHCQRTFRTTTEAMGVTAVCSGCHQSFRIGEARPPFTWKPTSLAEDSWIGACVDGVLNVMRRFGMLPGDPAPPRGYLTFETKDRVNPSFGGLFFPANEDERFGREVRKGEVLGRVVSPYTFEVLEELVSPFDGYVAYYARWYPVQPGDWAYGIVPKDHPGTRWVDPPAGGPA